jgi:hypothetical protein
MPHWSWVDTINPYRWYALSNDGLYGSQVTATSSEPRYADPPPIDGDCGMDELDHICTCGHMNPEHSIFGTCRGCIDCSSCEDDHPYEQCPCREYVPSSANVR